MRPTLGLRLPIVIRNDRLKVYENFRIGLATKEHANLILKIWHEANHEPRGTSTIFICWLTHMMRFIQHKKALPWVRGWYETVDLVNYLRMREAHFEA